MEGLFDDVIKGTKPKLLEERGWRVDQQFKTKRYKRVIALSALTVLIPVVIGIMKKGKSPI